jgi:hypothetical protein
LLAHQPGFRRQRHDLLLDPVVQDRLDPAPLGVLARHDPVPGGRQLGGEVQVVHADRRLGGEVGQQPAVLGEQRPVGARAAFDAPEGDAPMLDGNDRGGLADRGAVDRSAAGRGAAGRGMRRTAGRLQRHPGPGQVQVAADLAGQVAQQLGRAGRPGQPLTETAEAGVAGQPRAEHPAVGGLLQTGPNGLARRHGGHRDRHSDGDRRGQAGQHASHDRQEREHDANRYPQHTVDERAPRGLVDAEYPGVEERPEHRPQRGDLRQAG